MKHKWHKEIIHWANGGEIEVKENDEDSWSNVDYPSWDNKFGWEYRIKPQPKEPQYLYVWKPYEEGDDLIISDRKPKKNDIVDDGIYKLIGKIKLEQDE